MKAYLLNFYHGMRLALFQRVRAEDFRLDWAAFWIAVLFMVGVQLAASFIAAEPPRYFNTDAFQGMAFTITGYLLCGFAAVLLLRRPDLQLKLPTLVLYAGMLPMVIDAALYDAARMPWWAKVEDLWAFFGFIMGWLFLAYFRALDLCVRIQAAFRQIVLAALPVAVMTPAGLINLCSMQALKQKTGAYFQLLRML